MVSVSLLVAISVSVVSFVSYMEREKEIKDNAIQRTHLLIERESESIKSFMQNKTVAIEK